MATIKINPQALNNVTPLINTASADLQRASSILNSISIPSTFSNGGLIKRIAQQIEQEATKLRSNIGSWVDEVGAKFQQVESKNRSILDFLNFGEVTSKETDKTSKEKNKKELPGFAKKGFKLISDVTNSAIGALTGVGRVVEGVSKASFLVAVTHPSSPLSKFMLTNKVTKNATMAYLATDRVQISKDIFYNTKVGKTLDKNAHKYFKQNSKIMGILDEGSQIVSTMIVGALTAGSGAIALTGISKGGQAMSKNLQQSKNVSFAGIKEQYKKGEIDNQTYQTIKNVRNMNDKQWKQFIKSSNITKEEKEQLKQYREMPEDWKTNKNLAKSSLVGALTGGWEAIQWYTGSKIGTLKIKNAPKYVSSIMRVSLDTVMNASDTPYRSAVDSLINGKTFKKSWKDQGGWQSVIVNSIIGATGSTAGELLKNLKSIKNVGKNTKGTNIKGKANSTNINTKVKQVNEVMANCEKIIKNSKNWNSGNLDRDIKGIIKNVSAELKKVNTNSEEAKSLKYVISELLEEQTGDKKSAKLISDTIFDEIGKNTRGANVKGKTNSQGINRKIQEVNEVMKKCEKIIKNQKNWNSGNLDKDIKSIVKNVSTELKKVNSSGEEAKSLKYVISELLEEQIGDKKSAKLISDTIFDEIGKNTRGANVKGKTNSQNVRGKVNGKSAIENCKEMIANADVDWKMNWSKDPRRYQELGKLLHIEREISTMLEKNTNVKYDYSECKKYQNSIYDLIYEKTQDKVQSDTIVKEIFNDLIDKRGGYINSDSLGSTKINVMKDINWNNTKVTVNEVKTMLNQLPQTLRKAVKSVNISDLPNSSDSYWARQYNKKDFSSACTGGRGNINIYGKAKGAINKVEIGEIAHEAAHTLDQELLYKSRSSEWIRAMQEDAKIKGNSIGVTKYATQAHKACGTNAEDFAESFSLWVTKKEIFKKKYPNRYKILKEILNEK